MKFAKRAGSGKLTLYLLFFLLFVILFRSFLPTEESMALPYVLLALLCNLFASLYLNFRSLERKPGLFIFHVGLILLILFSGWGRLVYFKGYFEIEEGGTFEGSFVRSMNGILYQPRLFSFKVSREKGTNSFSLQKRRNIYQTRLRFFSEETESGSAIIGSGLPVSYEGFNFFLLRKNHGISVYLNYKNESNETDHMVGMNIPLSMPRTTEFTLPGQEEKISATLLLDEYDPKSSYGTIPGELKVIFQSKGHEPQVFSQNQTGPFREGTLTFSDMRMWDGFQVTYNPTLIYLALISFISAVGISTHFLGRAMGASLPAMGSFKRLLFRADIVIPFLLMAITFMIFWRVYYFQFIWDDTADIVKNRNFNPPDLNNISNFWKKPFLYLYIPVTYSVWGIVAGISRLFTPVTLFNGLNPGYFHIVNVLFHSINTVLVYVVIKNTLMLYETRKVEKNINFFTLHSLEISAGFGAMFFALHPLQVETVAWINGLRSMLAGFFSFAAIWQYLLYVKKKNTEDNSEGQSCHYGLASICYFLALLSKPVSVTVPCMLLIFSFTGTPLKKRLMPLIPWFLMALIVTLLNKMAQPDAMIKYITPLWARPVIALDSLAFYLGKLLLPFNNVVDYSRTSEAVLGSGKVFFSCMVPLFIILLLRRFQWKVWYLLPFGIFLFGLFPTLGFIPFSAQHISNVADRYIYLAMLGPSIFVSWVLFRSGKKEHYLIAVLVFTLWGIKDSVNKWHWKTEIDMFKHVVKINSNSFLGHHFVGTYLLNQGKLEEADFHFSEMGRIRPSYLKSPHFGSALTQKDPYGVAPDRVTLDKGLALKYNKLGNELMEQHRFKEAAEKYRRALNFNPEAAQIYNNLGVVLDNLGNLDEAIAQFEKGLALAPGLTEIYINLAIALGDQNKHAEAEEVLRKALSREIENPVIHNNLGISLVEQGRIVDGINEFKKALKLDPQYEEAVYNLGYAGRFSKPDPP